jgi:2-aminoadipate transaminase
LAILSRLLLNPGDPAVVEEITFTGVQQITKGRGANVRTIPTDYSSGADMEAMEKAFQMSPKPSLAVLIPDFHNPLGVTLTREKREHAAALAAKYQVPILEDDPYSALRFTGISSPPIKAFDEAGFVFYIGSFSKMLAPSVRLGWIVSPPELISKITVLRESLDLESSTLIQRAVMEFIEMGLLEPYLEKLTSINKQGQMAMHEALTEHLGEMASWTQPEGGIFTWVTLSGGIDTWEMFPAAIERKLAYIPGSAFATDGGYENTMRLNFSTSNPEAIREAVRRLAEVTRDRMRAKVNA